MFNRDGDWSDRGEWDNKQAELPGLGISLTPTEMLGEIQAKGILSQRRSESRDFPGLEKGHGNLLNERPQTFHDHLLATLSKGTFVPRDSQSQGREL